MLSPFASLSPFSRPRFVASGGGFVPTDIAGCLRYGSVNALALSNNDPVSSYTDLSGNGSHYTASTTARPAFKTGIINGRAAMLFNGSTNVMSSTVTKSNPFTVFIVLSFTAGSGYSLVFDTASSGFNYAGRRSSAEWVMFPGAAELTGGSVVNDQFYILTLVYNTTSKFYVNGILIASGAFGTNPLTGTLLGNANNASAPFTGYVAEDTIHNSALSNSDLNLLGNYFAGLTGISWTDIT